MRRYPYASHQAPERDTIAVRGESGNNNPNQGFQMAIRKRRAELAELEAAMKEAKRRDRRSVFVIGSKPSDDTEGDPHWGRRKSDLNHATPVRVGSGDA